jgi:hypothetical protein
MADLSTTNSRKPAQTPDSILRAGNTAYALYVKYQPILDARLPALTGVNLSDDLKTIVTVLPGPKTARAETGAAVATQLVLLGNGARVIGTIRDLVRSAHVSKGVKKAYGIGVRVNPAVPKDVLAVLKLIQDRASNYPAEPATLGIAQEDLDAVKQSIAEIGDAFQTKQQKRAAAPLSTKQRNQVLNRILLATGLISAAGAAAFRNNPEVAKRFTDAGPPPVPKKKKSAAAKKPAAAKPATKAAAPAAPAADPAKDPAKDAPANDAPPAAPASTPEAPPAAATPATPAAA